MSVLSRFGAGSRLALAFALAGGLTVTAAAPAHAQKKAEKTAERKASYSKGFAAAYKPLEPAAKANDFAAMKAGAPALIAAAETADDKFLAGQTAYLAGSKTADPALEKQGLELMLASGVADAKQTSQLHYRLGEIALDAKNYAEAQAAAQRAIDAGQGVDGEILIARVLLAQNQFAPGVERLEKAITSYGAGGQQVPQSWYKSAIANAVKGNLAPQAVKYAVWYAKAYPTATSWSDAINVQRNMMDYDAQETLDLMRLAQRSGALTTGRDYADYIRAIDARRLPGEAQRAIAAATSAGLLTASDPLVAESNDAIAQRLKADQAGLPGLAAEARASGATAATVMAAGDAFLSYGQPAEAEEFYTLALTKPGVDTGRALTRLGIAQVDLGKTAEAQATFAKVEGSRQPIAGLWAIHAAKGAGKP